MGRANMSPRITWATLPGVEGLALDLPTLSPQKGKGHSGSELVGLCHEAHWFRERETS